MRPAASPAAGGCIRLISARKANAIAGDVSILREPGEKVLTL